MINRPGHAVNDGLSFTDRPIGTVAGLDFDASVSNVAAWGGQVAIYRHVAAAALTAAGPSLDPELALAVAGLAGWRAGVLDLRTAALAHLDALVAGGFADVAAAALGLDHEAVSQLGALQQRSPLGWPRQPVGAVVARVGGFRGLGGPWSTPPVAGWFDAAGRLRVRCADGTGWQLTVDVFGARVTPLPEDQPVRFEAAPAGVRISATSYLVRLTAVAA